MANAALEIPFRIRRGARALGLGLLKEDLLKIADDHFAAVEDVKLRAEWDQLRSACAATGRPLKEVADELAELSGDVELLADAEILRRSLLDYVQKAILRGS